MISQTIHARDYQLKAVRNIGEALARDTRTLVVMPTGTGKTVVFWQAIDEWLQRHPGQRVLIIAHRSELIHQAANKGRAIGLDVDIEMGELRANRGFARSQVVVATVQTLNAGQKCKQCQGRLALKKAGWERDGRTDPFPGIELGCERCLGGILRRLQKFPAEEFGLVVVDEAHHSTADSYVRIFDWFGDRTHLLGVTATPDRHDEAALGKNFHSVAYEYDLPTAIQDGWLVPIHQQFVEVDDLDLSRARKNKYGDMQDKDVQAAMAEVDLHKMVYPTIELAGDRRTLVFAAGVQPAEQMADIFNRHRPGSAAWLSGDSSPEVRKRTLEQFKAGDIQYLCNCALFLEGFDDPGIQCVAVGRPTASRALYSQIVGRGTRPLPGVVDGETDKDGRRKSIARSSKPGVLVLDFVGNSGKHKLISTADILGGNEPDEVVALATELARKQTGSPADMAAKIEEAKERLRQKREEEERLREKRRQSNVKLRPKFSTKAVNPFDVFDVLPKREPGWHRGRKPTEKQREALARFGVDEGAIQKASFCQASQMLDELVGRRKKGLCSLKQARILRRHGFGTDVTFEAASRTIDAIAKSGWKLRGNE